MDEQKQKYDNISLQGKLLMKRTMHLWINAAGTLLSMIVYVDPMNDKAVKANWARDKGGPLMMYIFHFAGYSSVSICDINQLRHRGSQTPGHPENLETEGIEDTTGPLGMGIFNDVGLAAAEPHLSAVYNKQGLPLIDHYTYCITGDGCSQENLSQEPRAYAGHLGLGKLIAFWDDNGITIDGHTELSFTEDVGKRYEAYGWQMLTMEEGNMDVNAIHEAIAEANARMDKPTLIKVKTTIGHGSPCKADSHNAHGAPLDSNGATATQEQLGWKYGKFEDSLGMYGVFKTLAAEGARKQEAWKALWAEYQKKEPEAAKHLRHMMMDKKMPEGWEDAMLKAEAVDKGKATQPHSQGGLNAGWHRSRPACRISMLKRWMG